MTDRQRFIHIAFITVLISAASCGVNIRNTPTHLFENYSFNENSALIDRVTEPPLFVTDYLKKIDNNPNYQPYRPDHADLLAIKYALDSLPPLTSSLMKKRLIGIYFIKNFQGSGLADWVVDSKNNIYVFMVFNESVLRKTLSELLTSRERTCYKADTSGTEIVIDCGKQHSGLYYILPHESTHAVDYLTNITPYVEPNINKNMKINIAETDFTKKTWKSYDSSRETFIFSNRVSFYGFHKPRLNPFEAEQVYRDLTRSPFISLYGSQNWAEDLAEMVVFDYITRILRQPYTINVFRGGKKILSIRPMESPEVKKRLPMLKMFYAN